MTATSSDTATFAFACALLAHGVPVVVCTPNPRWAPGAKIADLEHPAGWSTITAEECDISAYRPGVDALAMVSGHGVDAVDVDTKAGGSTKNLPPFRYFGITVTPSGGAHFYVRSTGIGKLSPLTTSSGHVGDYAGGTPGGGGRMLVYLPGSTRPKYPGRPYDIIQTADLDTLLEHDPDDDLIAALIGAGGNRNSQPGNRAARWADVRAWRAEHDQAATCPYGRSTVAALLAQADSVVPGDPTLGRHGWATRSAARVIELANAGCASAHDLDVIAAKLDEIKPEGGTDFGGCVAWALTNADGVTRCSTHRAAPQSPPPKQENPEASAPQPPQEPDAAETFTPSWSPVDLSTYVDGTHQPATPTLLHRTDGQALLYPGLVHDFHGESESGKSLVVQHLAAQLVNQAQGVLYVDYESDAAQVVRRLLDLGAAPDAIRTHFTYIRPEASPRAVTESAAWQALLERTFTLAVLDGVTDALGIHGGTTTDNDDIATWHREVPRTLARSTDAAVALIDHVTKNSETRGRFAIGGQAKMAAIDGASYNVEVVEPIGRGMRGTIALRVGKDRPGEIRAACGKWRSTDRSQEAARIVVDSTGEEGPGIHLKILPPEHRHDDEGDGKPFKPTAVMEKLSRLLEARREPITFNALLKAFRSDGGRARERLVAEGVDQLVAGGFVVEQPGARGSRMLRSAGVYRQRNDPDSDGYRAPFNGLVENPDRLPPTASPLPPGGGQVTASRTASPEGGAGGSDEHGRTSPPPAPTGGSRAPIQLDYLTGVRFNRDTGEVLE